MFPINLKQTCIHFLELISLSFSHTLTQNTHLQHLLCFSSMTATQSNPSHLFLNVSFLVLIPFYLTTQKTITLQTSYNLANDLNEACDGPGWHESPETKCTSVYHCDPEGYINYLYLFYCIYGDHPLIGYTGLTLWLMLLFYLLANTTATYFCTNLEGLSKILNLSPALAGVTLLSLGNGAPDVFATIVSFVGASNNSDVGLNCVLGGALFVSTVVVGTISICVGPRGVSIDKSSFLRDVCFLLLVLSVLIAILLVGEINMWGAMAFTSLYVVYALLVSLTHFSRKEESVDPPVCLPGNRTNETVAPPNHPLVQFLRLFAKNLHKWKRSTARPPTSFSELPTHNKDIESPLLSNIIDRPETTKGSFELTSTCRNFLYYLELPLYLPRRLTIPDVCKKRWSKSFAVASVSLAPVLLATLWDSKREEMGSEESLVIYVVSVVTGLLLGLAALLKTNRESPPESFLLPWLAGGFMMSVVWTYIIAEELVSLLVSFGTILGIRPSILGLTVLAWGNSIGDLIANLAVARGGGPGGAQVGISGCYGGPVFNTVMGLGLSLLFSSWAGPYVISKDHTIFQTVGFLMGGLLWALVILPRRGMKPDMVLGCGLLSIYVCFLCLRFAEALGFLQLQ